MSSSGTPVLQLRLGDCITILKTIAAGSVGAIVTDPPYGLEFMGKDFDSFRHIRRDFDALPNEWVQAYQGGLGVASVVHAPGSVPVKLLVFQGTPVKPDNWKDLVQAQLAGEPLPAPAYPNQQNWKYPISEHGFTDGGNRLPEPSFTSNRNPTCQNCGHRQHTWKGGPPACTCGQSSWKYGFSEGGWDGKNYPETPTFESSRNPVCQECHKMKRGSISHEQCECNEPAFDDVQHRVQDRQKFQAWCVLWLTECYRVLRPGGVIKVFGATRMMHRMAAAMDEAGFVLDPENSLEGWVYGCLTEDTEILTADGWVPHHKAKVGTLVLGFDLGTGQFNWQPVEDTFKYPYDREAFRLVGGGTDHIVSVGHRCVVQRGGQWAKVLAGDLEATEVVPCVSWPVPPQDAQASLYLAGVTASIERVHYTGIVWCVKVPTGAFVARRNGMAFVTGNSGFPKSLNVGKVLDQLAGAEREVVGLESSVPTRPITADWGRSNESATAIGLPLQEGNHEHLREITAPATAEAKQFAEYGTALKPAFEPFIVGTKTLT